MNELYHGYRKSQQTAVQLADTAIKDAQYPPHLGRSSTQ